MVIIFDNVNWKRNPGQIQFFSRVSTQENLNDEVEFYYLDMQMFENVISELTAELEYLKNEK